MQQRMAWIGVVLIGCGLVAPAAQAQNEKVRNAPSPLAGLFNVDAFLDGYVRLVARKYRLDEEQERYTAQLVRERAQGFIDRHEDDLYDLLENMFDVRAGGDMSPEELIAWGERARPIYEDAKQIVIEANDQWREVLTDEQRAIHDGDVALMWDNFEITETHLDRMVSGTMTVEEFRNPPRYETGEQPAERNDPPVRRTRPVEPAPEADEDSEPNSSNDSAEPHSTLPPPKRGTTDKSEAEPDSKKSDNKTRTGSTTTERPQDPKNYETVWDTYTRNFIEKYELNEAQAQKAESILQRCKQQGKQVVMRSEKRLAEIDSQIAELRKTKSRDKSHAANLQKLETQRGELLKPLTAIFEKRLKPQLDKLPTRAQRAAAEKAPEKKTKSRTPSRSPRTPESRKDDKSDT